MNPTACSAIITREADGKVFLGRRTSTKRSSPGLWETIGGSVEAGESPEDCIRREIKEELAASIDLIRHFKDYVIDGRTFRVFVVTLKDDPVPDMRDIDDVGWFDADATRDMNFALNCRQRLLDYFASLGMAG
jgi:8-oxo-dGTP diphosphatase